MDGSCLENLVSDSLLRSFSGILEKNGHTYMRLEEFKPLCAGILKRALAQCDFSISCEDCSFRGSPSCNEYKKNFVQSIVPAWFAEKMEAKELALCYWDKEASKLHFFKSLERAAKSEEDVWVADYNAIRAEADIAHRILNRNREPMAVDEELLERVLKWSQINEKFQLSTEQKDVVKRALSERLVVVDGGPGTGKTTILRVIYQYYVNRFGVDNVFCAAPTGKAAKRLADVTHSYAQTLHRLLAAEYVEEEDESIFFFDKNNHHPGAVFILDEASMIDARVFQAFMEAITNKAILVLVGDSHQLPSVGEGRILADLIGSGLIPVCTLVENFRQLENSLIVKNASSILHGKNVDFPETEGSDCHLITCAPNEFLDKIGSWVRMINPEQHLDAWRDMVILCPKKNGKISTSVINDFLQKQYAALRGRSRQVIKVSEDVTRVFAEDDRVIQVKNNYRLPCSESDGTERDGVFNGDIGAVRKVYKYSDLAVDVCFDDGRFTTYPIKNASELELAYALTVHKAQGAEWKNVLLVLPDEYGSLFNRNLLYTAVTRAKENLWILGSMETINRMIQRPYSDERKTALKIFLQDRDA